MLREVHDETDYMLACGVVWRRTADPEAGWDLVDGLKSRDPEVRVLAQTFLVESGESSMGLLESALAAGNRRPDVAGPCMAEILQKSTRETVDWRTVTNIALEAPLRWEVDTFRLTTGDRSRTGASPRFDRAINAAPNPGELLNHMMANEY